MKKLITMVYTALFMTVSLSLFAEIQFHEDVQQIRYADSESRYYAAYNKISRTYHAWWLPPPHQDEGYLQPVKQAKAIFELLKTEYDFQKYSGERAYKY